MKLLRSYYLLCKPNVVYMMLICALVGMLLAEQTISSVSTILIALIGIALCSGSAAAINQVIDRKADAAMTRTDQRPLPQGELSALHASSFALVIGVVGALILFLYRETLTSGSMIFPYLSLIDSSNLLDLIAVSIPFAISRLSMPSGTPARMSTIC